MVVILNDYLLYLLLIKSKCSVELLLHRFSNVMLVVPTTTFQPFVNKKKDIYFFFLLTKVGIKLHLF